MHKTNSVKSLLLKIKGFPIVPFLLMLGFTNIFATGSIEVKDFILTPSVLYFSLAAVILCIRCFYYILKKVFEKKDNK